TLFPYTTLFRSHTCALLKDGRTLCWGKNDQGQLGNGEAVISSTMPVNVGGINHQVRGLGLGGLHTCAVVEDAVKCWGNDVYGQLGVPLPSPSYSTTPVDV